MNQFEKVLMEVTAQDLSLLEYAIYDRMVMLKQKYAASDFELQEALDEYKMLLKKIENMSESFT